MNRTFVLPIISLILKYPKSGVNKHIIMIITLDHPFLLLVSFGSHTGISHVLFNINLKKYYILLLCYKHFLFISSIRDFTSIKLQRLPGK